MVKPREGHGTGLPLFYAPSAVFGDEGYSVRAAGVVLKTHPMGLCVFPTTIPGERDMLRTRNDFLDSYGGPGNPYDGQAAVFRAGAVVRLSMTRSAHCN